MDKQATQGEYGAVDFQGTEIIITQLPYIAGTHDVPHYKATGIDKQGNEYMVKWLVTNPECADESEACDWTRYTVRFL
jgi:hypothetical protein